MRSTPACSSPTADGGLRWRHALTQDAVLATLTGPERSVLAADAARALDRDDLAGPVLARVAELHARGGDPDRAAALLLRHAREHRAAGARSAALAVLEQATALAGEGHRVPVALERVEVLALAARTDEALAVGGPLLGRADGPALAVSLARACVAAERFAEAQDFLARAADPDDPRVLAVAAHVAAGTGEVTHAVDLAAAARWSPPGATPPARPSRSSGGRSGAATRRVRRRRSGARRRSPSGAGSPTGASEPSPSSASPTSSAPATASPCAARGSWRRRRA